MNTYFWVKVIHILSSTILFGAGIGTAFQMWFAHRSNNVQAMAVVSRNVVLADYLLTTPAGIIQPVTGGILIWLAGFDPTAPWLIAAYLLYGLAMVCWLPVVWLQIKIRDSVDNALRLQQPLPPAYHRYMRIWFMLGWPAFIALVIVFWLMVTKPML